MNFDKLEQSAFNVLSHMRADFDHARELLRKLYPVGTILDARLWEDQLAMRFEVVSVSDDGYDLAALDRIKVRALAGSGESMAELHWNDPVHHIQVISRPRPEVTLQFEI